MARCFIFFANKVTFFSTSNLDKVKFEWALKGTKGAQIHWA